MEPLTVERVTKIQIDVSIGAPDASIFAVASY